MVLGFNLEPVLDVCVDVGFTGKAAWLFSSTINSLKDFTTGLTELLESHKLQ